MSGPLVAWDQSGVAALVLGLARSWSSSALKAFVAALSHWPEAAQHAFFVRQAAAFSRLPAVRANWRMMRAEGWFAVIKLATMLAIVKLAFVLRRGRQREISGAVATTSPSTPLARALWSSSPTYGQDSRSWLARVVAASRRAATFASFSTESPPGGLRMTAADMAALFSELQALRSSPATCDVTLVALPAGEKVRAHRCILTAASAQLRALVAGASLMDVPCADTDPEALHQLVAFIYGEAVEISSERVAGLEPLLALAVRLGVAPLVLRIGAALEAAAEDPAHACDALRVADHFAPRGVDARRDGAERDGYLATVRWEHLRRTALDTVAKHFQAIALVPTARGLRLLRRGVLSQRNRGSAPRRDDLGRAAHDSPESVTGFAELLESCESSEEGADGCDECADATPASSFYRLPERLLVEVLRLDALACPEASVLAAALSWLHAHLGADGGFSAGESPPRAFSFSPFDSPAVARRHRGRDNAGLKATGRAGTASDGPFPFDSAVVGRVLGVVRLSLIPADFLAGLVEGVLPRPLVLAAYRDKALAPAAADRTGTPDQTLPAAACSALKDLPPPRPDLISSALAHTWPKGNDLAWRGGEHEASTLGVASSSTFAERAPSSRSSEAWTPPPVSSISSALRVHARPGAPSSEFPTPPARRPTSGGSF